MGDPIKVGDTVRIEKGCRPRLIHKWDRAKIARITPMGAEGSHMVAVALSFTSGFLAHTGRTVTFYARHANRLADPTVTLNDGNPLHKISIAKIR